MAAIEKQALDDLVSQIQTLKKTIETAGDDGRNKLAAVNVNGGALDPNADDETRKKYYARLVQVRDSLRAAINEDGPPEPDHIMHVAYPTTTTVVTATVVSVAVVLLLFWSVFTRWDAATNTSPSIYSDSAQLALAQITSANHRIDTLKARLADTRAAAARAVSTGASGQQANADSLTQTIAFRDGAVAQLIRATDNLQKTTAKESLVLLMVGLLGALGGSLHLVGSLAKYIGNRQLKRSWLIYYLSLPLVGGALATIVYLLLRVGILTPSAGTGDPTGALKNLNLIGIYAFAALTGMFATTATDKLRDVFGTIFRTERPSKDGIGAEKAPGVVPAAATATTGAT